MMNLDYRTGVGMSLALSSARLVYDLCRRTSVFHANLAKIGVRQSFATSQFKRGGSLLWEVPTSVVTSGLIGLLSWVGVAAYVLLEGYAAWVRFRMPPRFVEARRQLRDGPLTEREAAERFVAFAEMLSGGAATPSEREKAILWVLSHVRFTGTDDSPLDLFDRTPEGKLLAVGRNQIEEEIAARRRIICIDNHPDESWTKWLFDVVEMQALRNQFPLERDERLPPRLYDLRRSNAEHWEMREHLTHGWVSVPAQHASGVEALLQSVLATGVPDIGLPTLATWYAEELQEVADGS